MTVAISTLEQQSGYLRIDIVGNATAVGLVGQVENPEGVDLQIVEGHLWIEEGAHAANTMNFGIGAEDADASDLLSAFAMNATDDTVWKVIGTDLASEGAETTPKGVNWDAGEFLTVTSAAQVSTGLKASLFLKYIRLEAQP
jgi:hypothetical protein